MPQKSKSRKGDLSAEAIVSDASISRDVSRAVKGGALRKLASRLYTSNLTDQPEKIVRRNLWSIVAVYFPGALIADRTALENEPASDGSICLITKTGKNIDLPGLILRPRRGRGPLPSDRPFIGGLHLSSIARAYLENIRPSRARAGVARTLSRRQIEERLDTLIRHGGPEAAKRLRDEIRTAARLLSLQREAKQLDTLIGALLGTRDAALATPSGRARRQGTPFDPNRLTLFQTLHSALRSQPPITRMAPKRTASATSTLAFYEAYFSNFIEGTEFAVKEAAAIIFRGVIPRARPADAHDVLGTWRLVSNAKEMSRIPRDGDSLLELLRSRHAGIMKGRPDRRPGEFKDSENRAGGTVFVAPELVIGTLTRGFELGRSLETPFQRAVFMMLLVAEVHPFVDGNGRTARIMMNAELIAAGEERIVIPTVYRANYLSALKALSQSGHPEPLIRTMDFAQRWTNAISWRSVNDTHRALAKSNAFLDPAAAEQDGKRLILPS